MFVEESGDIEDNLEGTTLKLFCYIFLACVQVIFLLVKEFVRISGVFSMH